MHDTRKRVPIEDSSDATLSTDAHLTLKSCASVSMLRSIALGGVSHFNLVLHQNLAFSQRAYRKLCFAIL
jgi:hypothetical protein